MSTCMKRARHPRHALLAAAGIGVAVLTTAGCTGSGSSANGGANGSSASGPLVWAVNADVTGLDPQNNGQDVSQNIMALVYEQLLTLGDGVHVSPQLASGYKQVSPTVYDFTLRSGVKFSNGRELTTDDVVKSFQRIRSKKEGSYLAARLGAITSIKATDSHTVEFTLSRPFSGFLAAVADPAAAILPMKELDGGTFDPTKTMLGTGPYLVSSHQQGSSWTFAKNPYYWRTGLPKVDQVRITVLPDQGTQIAALRGGSAGIATFSSSEAADLTSRIPGVKVVTQTTSAYYILLTNDVSSPQLKSVQTRQGINLALDRSQIASVALGGHAVPVGPAPGLPDSCPVSALPYSKQDITRAQQSLAAGGRLTKPLVLKYDTAFPDMANIAQVIKSQLAKVDVQVNLQPLPDGQYLTDLVGGNFDLGLTFYRSADPYFGLVNWSPSLSGFTSKFSTPVPAIETNLPLIAAETGTARTEAIGKVCAAADQDSAQMPLVSKTLTVAWNKNKLTADVLSAENGADPLRNIASFTSR